MVKIFIETYGCTYNQNDSEIIAGILEKEGHIIVNKEEDADILIINTCIVKSPTEEKVKFRILELAKKYPNKKMIIAGCLAEALPEVAFELNPKASLISPFQITKISKVVQKILKGEKVVLIGKEKIDKLLLPKKPRSKVVYIVPIASGCLGNCAYCIVKKAKGRLYSYPPEKIIKEIKIARSFGYKEFYLTSQDCACYGFDSDTNLAILINKICKEVRGKFYLRIGMQNPKHLLKILDDILEAYENEQVFKFLHLPIQSASNFILEKMKRGYKIEDVKKIIFAFKEKFPDITIWTDVIAGFPGEREEDFIKTKEFLEEFKFDMVFVSKFGVRPKTEAKKEKQLPSEIIKERSRILTKIARKTALEKNKLWENWEGEVLVDDKIAPFLYQGKNYAYKTFIFTSKANLLGKFVRVKGKKANVSNVSAEVV